MVTGHLQEEEAAAFAARQKARQEAADAKTSKNRARRQKRKAGGKANGGGSDAQGSGNDEVSGKGGDDSKRRKIGLGSNAAAGKMVFRRPGEESDVEEDDVGVNAESGPSHDAEAEIPSVPIVNDEGKIVIHDSE